VPALMGSDCVQRVSVEEAFLWARHFVAREWRLIVPVALAFLAVPPLAFDLLIPKSVEGAIATGATGNIAPAMSALSWVLPIFLLILVIGFLGGLTITALALIPAISVREAIGLAIKRMGSLIGAMLLLMAALLLVATLVAIIGGVARIDPVTLQAMLLGVILGLGLLVSTRLVTLAPLIVDRNVGPVAAIRASWALSRGVFWRLFGALLVYLVGASVILIVLSTAVSAVFLIGARAVGMPEIGPVLSTVLIRAGAALVSAGLHILIVAFYRQLSGSAKAI
jgi:hypothetical protein